jgi:hypothetical protein
MILNKSSKRNQLYILIFLFSIIIMAIFINSAFGQRYDLIQPKGQFMMEITGNPKDAVQRETNLTIVKVVDPSNGRLQYRYDIITPVVDDFHFVLALDSSSSLKASPNSDEAIAVINAVPMFIDETIKNHGDKKFSISIVSWDDNIDFAYSPFNNKDSGSAKLVKIQNASTDLKRYQVFGRVNDTGYKYSCLDEDHTDLSLPVDSAINILDKNPPIKYHRTSNFTIIVVGDGEYTKCNEKLIREAQDKGYAIYAILLDYSKSSDMFSHLKNITGDENRVFTCIADENTLESNLKLQLKNALEKALSEPVAEDVILYDHFNDFIPPGKSASIEVVGFPGTRRPITPNISNNSIMIKMPTGLSAKNVTRITLDAHIDLKNLATSFSNRASTRNESSDNSKSTLSYRWLRERYPFEVELPESSINITGPIYAGQAINFRIWIARVLGM